MARRCEASCATAASRWSQSSTRSAQASPTTVSRSSRPWTRACSTARARRWSASSRKAGASPATGRSCSRAASRTGSTWRTACTCACTTSRDCPSSHASTASSCATCASRGDLLWVEGQGAILHPVYSGVTVGLIHGSAPHLYVLCHEVGRTITEGDPTESPLPSLPELIQLHERMSLKRRPAKVVAISLNPSTVSEDEARAAVAAAEDETGLPADDPVRFGAGKLLEAVLNAQS